MNKKALMVSLIILMIPVLYTISTVTATFNRTVSYSSVKGGECGSNLEWVSYESQISELNLGWARIPLRWDLVVNSSYQLVPNDRDYLDFLAAVRTAYNMGAKIIITIKGVPNITAQHW